MNNTDYAVHDKYYKQYKDHGNEGWGESIRFKQWQKTIDNLGFNPNFPKSGELLELGCGAGNTSILFSKKGYKVTGVDISPTAIAWAKERYLENGFEGTFLVDDVCQLGSIKNSLFDVVIDGNCFHCIIGEDRQLFLKNVRRALKNNGVFYISTHCDAPKPEWIENRPDFTYNTEERIIYREHQPYRYIAQAASLLEEVKASGFSLIQHKVDRRNDYGHLKAIFTKC